MSSLSLHTQLSVFLVDNVTLKNIQKYYSLNKVLISAALIQWGHVWNNASSPDSTCSWRHLSFPLLINLLEFRSSH